MQDHEVTVSIYDSRRPELAPIGAAYLHYSLYATCKTCKINYGVKYDEQVCHDVIYVPDLTYYGSHEDTLDALRYTIRDAKAIYKEIIDEHGHKFVSAEIPGEDGFRMDFADTYIPTLFKGLSYVADSDTAAFFVDSVKKCIVFYDKDHPGFGAEVLAQVEKIEVDLSENEDEEGGI